MQILVLNGPNLNLLGMREPEIYGQTTLRDIEQRMHQLTQQFEVKCECFQSNIEGELINKIQASLKQVDFIIFNPAGYTHTSVALRDALLAVQIPFIEVHISNIHQREEFRQISYFSDIAQGVICGLGAYGYELAFNYAVNFLKNSIS